MQYVSQIRLLNEENQTDILLAEGNYEWIHQRQFDYWTAQDLDGIVYAVHNAEPSFWLSFR